MPAGVSGFVSIVGLNSLEVYTLNAGDVGVYNFDITVKIAEPTAPLVIYQTELLNIDLEVIDCSTAIITPVPITSQDYYIGQTLTIPIPPWTYSNPGSNCGNLDY